MTDSSPLTRGDESNVQIYDRPDRTKTITALIVALLALIAIALALVVWL